MYFEECNRVYEELACALCPCELSIIILMSYAHSIQSLWASIFPEGT